MNGVTDFDRFRVTNPSQSEQFADVLYDSAVYPTAGAAQLAFFQTAAGAGVTSSPGATAGTVKSFSDTNMQVGGSLSSGLNFLIECIEVLFLPGSVAAANTYTLANVAAFTAVSATGVVAAANDVNTFYQSGVLELNILQKNYVRRAPLINYPPRSHLDFAGALASNSATTGVTSAFVAKCAGLPGYVDPAISIQSSVAFEVLLKWPGGVVATPSGFNGRVVVSLAGKTMRASQ